MDSKALFPTFLNTSNFEPVSCVSACVFFCSSFKSLSLSLIFGGAFEPSEPSLSIAFEVSLIAFVVSLDTTFTDLIPFSRPLVSSFVSNFKIPSDIQFATSFSKHQNMNRIHLSFLVPLLLIRLGKTTLLLLFDMLYLVYHSLKAFRNL